MGSGGEAYDAREQEISDLMDQLEGAKLHAKQQEELNAELVKRLEAQDNDNEIDTWK